MRCSGVVGAVGAAVLVAALAGCASPGRSAAALCPPVPSASSSPVPAPTEAQVRVEFGLPHDPASIARADRGPAATDVDLGIPLTPAEASDIEARDELGRWVGRVAAAGRRSPFFASVRVDQAAGGVVTIAVLPGAGGYRLARSLRSLVPASVRTRIDRARWSERTLDAAQARLQADDESGALARFCITSSGVMDDRLEVSVSTTAPRGTEAALSVRYGWPFLRISRGDTVDQ